MHGIAPKMLSHVRRAAANQSPVKGLTHTFYRYPARFSPEFVRTAIENFSKPGDLVLDPYMGGGTTVVEAMTLGRRVIGTDINALSVFVARVKSTRLTNSEREAVTYWATKEVSRLRCYDFAEAPEVGLRNMTLYRSRWLRKTITQCYSAACDSLSTPASIRFARCVLLNAGQWALNGRKQTVSATEFRAKVSHVAINMLKGLGDFDRAVVNAQSCKMKPVLKCIDAQDIHMDDRICEEGKADLIVTSPPYPGIHVLYHRWQVDGRRESNAPYWISGCKDGKGVGYYNFCDRRTGSDDAYFEKAEASFSSLRRVVRDGGKLLQLISFSNPRKQLAKYLEVLENCKFSEVQSGRRMWREVPGRKWHANLKGSTHSSREVLLVHKAT